jgi:hypothetical protein
MMMMMIRTLTMATTTIIPSPRVAGRSSCGPRAPPARRPTLEAARHSSGRRLTIRGGFRCCLVPSHPAVPIGPYLAPSHSPPCHILLCQVWLTLGLFEACGALAWRGAEDPHHHLRVLVEATPYPIVGTKPSQLCQSGHTWHQVIPLLAISCFLRFAHLGIVRGMWGSAVAWCRRPAPSPPGVGGGRGGGGGGRASRGLGR